MAVELKATKPKEAAKKAEDGIEETLTYCDFPSKAYMDVKRDREIYLNKLIGKQKNGLIKASACAISCWMKTA